MRRNYNLSGSVAFLYTAIKNSIIADFYGEMKREEGDDENTHAKGAGVEAAAICLAAEEAVSHISRGYFYKCRIAKSSNLPRSG